MIKQFNSNMQERGYTMEQMELQINRLSDETLSQWGYQLPSMTPQQEHRFGAIMAKAANGNGYRSGIGPKATYGVEKGVAAFMALRIAKRNGFVTGQLLADGMGMDKKSASNVLTILGKHDKLVRDVENNVGRNYAWALPELSE